MQLLKTFFISAVTLPRTCKQILMCEIRDEQLYVKYLNNSSTKEYSPLGRRNRYFYELNASD